MYEPFLSLPANGAIDQPLYPLLVWTEGGVPPEAGAVWEIYMSATGAFAGEQYSVALGIDKDTYSYQLDTGGNYPGTPSTTFYWRVEYYNGGPNEPSDTWSFTTGTGSSSSSSSSSSSGSSSSSSSSSSQSSSSSSFSSSSSSSSSDSPANFPLVSGDWIRDTTKFAAGASNYESKPMLQDNAITADVLATSSIDELWGAIATELVAEPGAEPTVREALTLLYMTLRNAETTTNGTKTIRNDAGTIIASSTLTDDGTTFTKSKLG